jgi:AcrR family transcriptional regulator
MASQKSIAPADTARAPQRARGHQRVAALLDAAAAVFAEKGPDAATMTEIAARAGAAIGSLYQFFPSKAALANALLARYADYLAAGLADIAARAPTLPPAALADALVDLMLDLRGQRSVGVALIDTLDDAAGRRAQLRQEARARIAAILRAANPALPPPRAAAMAVLVLHVLKSIPMLAETDPGGTQGLLAEARTLLRRYLTPG